MPANIRLNVATDDLARIERRLIRRFGRKAAAKFLARAANRAAKDVEGVIVAHLAARTGLPPAFVAGHVYFRQEADEAGRRPAVVALSPTRTVSLRKLDPVKTRTGVSWTFEGRRRSKRGAWIWEGRGVFKRKPEGGIGKVIGPRIRWAAAFDDAILERVEGVMADELRRWMREPVRDR